MAPTDELGIYKWTISRVLGTACRDVMTGGYIGIYSPKSAFVSSLLAVLFTCGSGTLTCFDFEIGMTS